MMFCCGDLLSLKRLGNVYVSMSDSGTETDRRGDAIHVLSSPHATYAWVFPETSMWGCFCQLLFRKLQIGFPKLTNVFGKNQKFASTFLNIFYIYSKHMTLCLYILKYISKHMTLYPREDKTRHHSGYDLSDFYLCKAGETLFWCGILLHSDSLSL